MSAGRDAGVQVPHHVARIHCKVGELTVVLDIAIVSRSFFVVNDSLCIRIIYCRFINMEHMVAASRLEEEFQLEIWGVVEGGHDMDRLNNAVRLSSVGLFMSLFHDQQQIEEMWHNWKRSL